MKPDAECIICGKKTNNLAGNPAEWPMWFPEADKPGVVRPHHTGCVLKKLNEGEKAIAKIVALKEKIKEFVGSYELSETCQCSDCILLRRLNEALKI